MSLRKILLNRQLNSLIRHSRLPGIKRLIKLTIKKDSGYPNIGHRQAGMTAFRFLIAGLLLMSLIMFPVSAYAEQGAGIEGVYDRLDGIKFSFDGRQVEVMEFLSFYCAHCYHFEKAIPVIKGNFPKRVKWTVVPVYWGSGSPKPGEAYFLAEEAGKGEEMKKALFEAAIVDKRDIGNIEVLDDIGMKIGLGFDFSRRLRAGEKAKDAGEAILKSKAYGIEETPSLVIAGNLKTSPGMFKGNTDLMRENVIIMLKSIFRLSP